MIDLKKYTTDEDELAFLEDLRECEKCLTEVPFDYKGREFIIDPHGEKICVYENTKNSKEYFFKDMDDFFENFILDGVSFIKRISQIVFEEENL